MNKDKIHSPYSLPATFRTYAYDEVVLAWEMQRVNIILKKLVAFLDTATIEQKAI